jgi:hypothetical protein
MFERTMHEADKRTRLHTASPHLPTPVRGAEGEEPPEHVLGAILTVAILAAALVVLALAL